LFDLKDADQIQQLKKTANMGLIKELCRQWQSCWRVNLEFWKTGILLNS